MTENFIDLKVSQQLVNALAEGGAVTPTEIQRQTIPEFLNGKDIVAQAPTGTGKTFAFGLPAIMKTDIEDYSVQTLVLCPTRELVMQITESLQKALKYTENIRIASIYGGQNIQKQLAILRKRPQIVVGTPGRTLDHISRKTLRLGAVKMFVLDEADEMLDMGFRGDIDKIIAQLPECRQTALFSATLSKEIMELTKTYLKEPLFIKTTLDGKDIPLINQYYLILKDAQRIPSLIRLIEENEFKLNLVFCNTKVRADKVNDALQSKGVKSEVLHGDLRQSQRDRIMKKFRSGELSVLVATDIAARGIDVKNVDAVFNFDPPSDEEFYVHRIGRTARAEKTGAAYTFVSDNQTNLIGIYQKATKTQMNSVSVENIGDSFTLPRDSSNRRARTMTEKVATSRFFVNVGTRDGLDKDSVKLILTKKAGIDEIDIFDIKLRDNYGFIEVPTEHEQKVLALAGMQIANRVLNIEIATSRPSQSEAKKKDGASRGERNTRTSRSGGKDSVSRGPRRRDQDSYNRTGNKRAASNVEGESDRPTQRKNNDIRYGKEKRNEKSFDNFRKSREERQENASLNKKDYPEKKKTFSSSAKKNEYSSKSDNEKRGEYRENRRSREEKNSNYSATNKSSSYERKASSKPGIRKSSNEKKADGGFFPRRKTNKE